MIAKIRGGDIREVDSRADHTIEPLGWRDTDRSEDGTGKKTWIGTKIADVEFRSTVVQTYGIGHRRCANCGKATPLPDDDELFEAAKAAGPYINFLWPFEHWTPRGWRKVGDAEICDDCGAAVDTALSARKVPK